MLKEQSLLTEASAPKKYSTISLVHPKTRRPMETNIEPMIMNGRLLPHLDLDLSAIVPTTGAMIIPDKGLIMGGIHKLPHRVVQY